MNRELKIPNHVAIILDGNGRWATERGLKRSKGHDAGFKNLKTLSDYILTRGVKILSVFAFSTENFKRSKEEVDYLMNLFVYHNKLIYHGPSDISPKPRSLHFLHSTKPVENSVLLLLAEL